jgi:hypothetical protein
VLSAYGPRSLLQSTDPVAPLARRRFLFRARKWSFKMPHEPNLEFADAIAIRIGQLINNTSNRSNEDVLVALMMTVADVIGSINCRDCRATAVENVKKMLPAFIDCAIEQTPIDRPSDHVH